MTPQISPGVQTADSDIPPPPDGSGIVPVAVPSNDNLPPPPDGSGIAPADASAPSEVQFGDDPNRVLSRMSPEDEAAYTRLLHTGSVDDINAFAHQHGFSADSDGRLAEFVAGRDRSKQAGSPVDYGIRYQRAPAPFGDDGRSFVRAAAQGALLGTPDELHGFLNGVGALLHGDSYSTAYDRTVDADRAQLGYDEENHGVQSALGNLAGGLLTPLGLEKSGLTATHEAIALRAGQDAIAAGATPEAAKVIAARAVARRLTGEGAAYGGAYGVGSSEGDPSQRLLAGAEGAGIGAAGGALLGRLGANAAGKPAAVAPAVNAVGEAANRLGLDALPADVGGPVTRSATAATMQTPFGAGPIIAAARKLNATAEERLGSEASQIGTAADDAEGLGTAATEGAVKYAKLAKAAGGRMYDRANDLAGGAQIDLKGARDTLDQQIARLQAVPGGGAGLEEAQALRASLDKPFSVQGVRDLRTEMFVPQEFRNTPVEGRTRAFVNAAARDIEDGLRAQGNGDAADAFRAADDNWRGLLANLKRNVEPVIGKLDNLKDPEAVAKALNSAAKNNGTRLGSFVNTLPPEQSGVVKASLLAKFGQDREGAFSVSRFAQDWDKMSPVAKRAMFGSESMSALNDLATVGRGSKAAMAFGNHSNTGRAVLTERTLGTLLTGGSLAGGLPAFGAAVVGQYGMGRLLASPRFARWLARAPRTSLGQTSYIERLGRIAKAEPAIASEVLGLQRRLTDATSRGSLRAAAEPDSQANVVDGQNGQGQPQQQQVTP